MKKYLCILLSSVLIFMNISYSVYAEVPPTYQKTKEYLWQIVQDIGFIGTLPFKGIVALVNDIIHSKGISGEEDVTTEEEALDYVFDGISINGDGNIVLNDNAKLNINTLIDNYKSDFGYYPVYGCSFQASTEYFGSNILEISKLLDGSNFIQVGTSFYTNAGPVYVYNYDSNDQLVVVRNSDYGTDWKYGTVYRILDNGVVKTVEPFYPNQGECDIYRAPNSSSIVNETQSFEFPLEDPNGNTYIKSYFNLKPNQSCAGSTWNTYPKAFSTNGNSMLMFNSVEAVHSYLESVGMGHYPYYVNNPIYDSFNTSSGDYVVDSNNKNTVTYGDVNTWIDDHHTETGSYPTMPEINIFIESGDDDPTPTPNPDNPSGGGSSGGSTASANNEGINININNNHNINVGIPSLSGNTVSGNGSGSSGGIFDWISNIGGVIGDFIKNVGQLIADVIKGLTETITTVLADIPNIISALVEFVYGGLPDELKAIVTLGITTVIFVGVIKMMRK